MTNQKTLIGRCANGHPVYLTHDDNDEVNGGHIGSQGLQPLPDGTPSPHKPIEVACDECVKVFQQHHNKLP